MAVISKASLVCRLSFHLSPSVSRDKTVKWAVLEGVLQVLSR